MLRSPLLTEQHHIQSKRHVVNHIFENYTSWVEYAKNSGDEVLVDFCVDQLTFVSGTTKASEYTVAVFSTSDDEAGKVSISRHMGPNSPSFLSTLFHDFSKSHLVDGDGFVVDAQNETTDNVQWLPKRCIFVHYYKVKQRPSLDIYSDSNGGIKENTTVPGCQVSTDL